MTKFMIKQNEQYLGSGCMDNGAEVGYAMYDKPFPHCPEVFYTQSESFAKTHLAYMIRNNSALESARVVEFTDKF